MLCSSIDLQHNDCRRGEFVFHISLEMSYKINLLFSLTLLSSFIVRICRPRPSSGCVRPHPSYPISLNLLCAPTTPFPRKKKSRFRCHKDNCELQFTADSDGRQQIHHCRSLAKGTDGVFKTDCYSLILGLYLEERTASCLHTMLF